MRLGERVVIFLCQGLGLGLSPIAPGTFGSAGGIALAGVLRSSFPTGWVYPWIVLTFTALGVALCSHAAKILNSKDPQSVVIDEIAAILMLFIFTPFDWRTATLGFFLFRAFDVTKPWPIRLLERLRGGWGIMADDLGAGVVAGAALYGMNSLLFTP